jgi:hypothetical protein
MQGVTSNVSEYNIVSNSLKDVPFFFSIIVQYHKVNDFVIEIH